jgi:uncharacterized protein (TIGR01777 family)
MSTVLITGGTGLVGKRLTTLLTERGYEVIIMSRRPRVSGYQPENVSYAQWDITRQTIDKEAITKADYIIHLAGEGVTEERWSMKRKKQIMESRVQSSILLIKGLKETKNQVRAVVSASAIGWYGEDSAESKKTGFTENILADNSFLGDTCKLWEDSIQPVEVLHKRVVKLRMGIVLSNDGGALAVFKKPIKSGIATILGSGSQVISWIHIDDLCRLFIYALENEEMNGVYNAVAPHPVTNKQLIVQLAKLMRGRFFVPVYVPAFVLQILLGKRSVEVLKSATISCHKLRIAGFSFLYPTIEAALKQLIPSSCAM